MTVSVAAIQPFDELMGEESGRLNALAKEWYDHMRDGAGRTHLVKHVISTTSQPIKQPHYRMPPYVLAEVDKKLKDMATKGIIERSSSPWFSNIVLVPKKDGSKRV